MSQASSRKAQSLALKHLSHRDRKLKSGKISRSWRVQLSGRTVWISSKLEPGSPEFIAAYSEALAQLKTKPREDIKSVITTMTWRKDEKGLVDVVTRVYGHCLFAEVTVQQIQQGLSKIKQAADEQGQAGADKANRVRSIMSKLWGEAVLRGLDDRNKVRDTKQFKHKQVAFKVWTDEEVEQALTNLRQDLAQIIIALYCTGQRKGDVITMAWEDIQDGHLAVCQNKTGTKLIMPMHPLFSAMITDIRNQRQELGIECSGRILLNTHGKPWTDKSVDTAMRRALDRIGLNDKTMHGLRHTAAVALDKAGCSLTEISSITGHKDLVQLQRYLEQRRQDRHADAAMARLVAWQEKQTRAIRT